MAPLCENGMTILKYILHFHIVCVKFTPAHTSDLPKGIASGDFFPFLSLRTVC
jgi:hypothetical protein